MKWAIANARAVDHASGRIRLPHQEGFLPVITAATTAGQWEKFRIVVGNPPPIYDKSFQTAMGNYITAVNGAA